MERDAHYALVGLISTALLVATVVFVVWLARFQFTRAYDVYDVDFKGPVRGLSNGGEVYFNGIKVGQVTKLSLDERNPDRVVARIRTSSDAPVRVDSIGTLEPLGVTGVAYIQITAGTLTKPLLKAVTPAGVIPVIRTAQSQIDSILEGGGTVLARTVDALNRVNRLLDDRNIKALGDTLDNVRDITAQARDQKKLLADLDTTLLSLNDTSGRISRLAQTADVLVNGQGRKALADLISTADEVRATAVDLRGAVNRVAGPAGDFAATGLPELGRSVVTLQQAAESLDSGRARQAFKKLLAV